MGDAKQYLRSEWECITRTLVIFCPHENETEDRKKAYLVKKRSDKLLERDVNVKFFPGDFRDKIRRAAHQGDL
eukprot:1523115-Karenia_brevis.AAC.1